LHSCREVGAEVRAEAGAEVEAEVRAEAKAGVEAEVRAEAEAEVDAEVRAESGPARPRRTAAAERAPPPRAPSRQSHPARRGRPARTRLGWGWG